MDTTSLLGKTLKRGRTFLHNHGYDIHPVDSRCWDDQRALLGDRREMVILDIGAHCGQTARQYRKLFPEAQIHCFEPQRDLCEQIANQFQNDSRISIYSCAVGAREGTATFYLNAQRSTSSLLVSDTTHLSSSYRPLLKNEELCSVPVITIDGFAESQKLTHIDLLKMDIQGGEYEALFGDLASYLARWNYSLHLIYNQTINGISGRPLQADAVFVPPQLREASIERLRTTWVS
jgi:FkbM family methyltransferase